VSLEKTAPEKATEGRKKDLSRKRKGSILLFVGGNNLSGSDPGSGVVQRAALQPGESQCRYYESSRGCGNCQS